MQEKEIFRRNSSLRTVFGFGNSFKFVLGRFSYSKNNKFVFLNLSEKGFTFIELIILTGVIFLLLSAFINIFNPLKSVQKINDQKRVSDLSEIKQALESYYQKYGNYPQSSKTFRITYLKQSLEWGQDGWDPYFSILPKDPLSNRQYVYYSDLSNGNQSYWLYASLEDPENNPDSCNNDCSLGSGNIPSIACGVNNPKITCNFGVTSSNVSP